MCVKESERSYIHIALGGGGGGGRVEVDRVCLISQFSLPDCLVVVR